MMISSRGRYALRVMVDLAETAKNGYVPMKIIAKRQGISLKYMEQILPVLTKNNLVQGIHGKGGGYRLCRKPEEYSVGEILRLTEGGLIPVNCPVCTMESCENQKNCRTAPLWQGLQTVIDNYLDGITLSDLMKAPETVS